MAFTFDVTTNRGKVRLLVGDTNASDAAKQIFSDAEIDAFLVLGDAEVYPAAAAACRSLATAAAASAIRMKAEQILEIDATRVPEHYRAMAVQFEAKSLSGPIEEIDGYAYQISHHGVDGSQYVGEPF